MKRLIVVGMVFFAVGLTLQAQAPAPAPAVTFAKDVAPILYSKCISCHRPGEVAPMSLQSYDEARPWAKAIKQKVAARQMPPWFADPSVGTFANDARLTDKQIDTIAKWVDAGAPRGNPKDEPALPKLTEGWQLGEPDYIITLPTVNIPAEGRDYFPTPNLTLDLPEDHWIRALEIRPGNRAVTHHSVIFAADLGAAGRGGLLNDASGALNVLGVWAVGTPPTVYPDGTGRWVRKGQMIRTNLHYHPNGTPQTDTTRIGLYFGKGELKKEVVSGVSGSLTLRIPAGAANHELRSTVIIDQDINIVSYFPHMHLRGKDMSLTALLPDGTRKPLLNVPAYDFNWQLFYYPKETVTLPKGTLVDLVAHYDNSAANRNNPNPNKEVTFGEQSSDEMMFGVFEYTPKEGVSPKPSTLETKNDALLAMLPADSSYRVPVTILRPFISSLYLPRQGEGKWYLLQGPLQTNIVPIKQINWAGDNFTFRVDIHFGPNAAFTFDVAGSVKGDGTLHADVTPVGVDRAPFNRVIDGTLRSVTPKTGR